LGLGYFSSFGVCGLNSRFVESAISSLDPDAAIPWLKTLFSDAHRFPYVLVGAGEDDCAVLQLGDRVLVLTTDFINAHPISIELKLGTLRDLGWYVVAANLSDLCASGAQPFAVLVGATLPRGSSEGDLRDLGAGIQQASQEFGVPIIGGDTKLGPARALFGVAVGVAKSVEALFLQTRARLDDDLWLSGPVGLCAAAVVGLSSGGIDQGWNRWARDAIVRPHLPLLLSRKVADSRVAHGGIDLSDGLAADVYTMCQASGVGARIDAASLPVPGPVMTMASAMDIPPYALALTIGGDLQFVVTADREHSAVLSAAGMTHIGRITEGSACEIQLPTGRVVAIPSQGHRDARAMTFGDEVRSLATEIAELVTRQ
jgi:thiamine-monophosphate kinase